MFLRILWGTLLSYVCTSGTKKYLVRGIHALILTLFGALADVPCNIFRDLIPIFDGVGKNMFAAIYGLPSCITKSYRRVFEWAEINRG
ncbi:unnamed protein product [Calypogeia fissa]